MSLKGTEMCFDLYANIRKEEQRKKEEKQRKKEQRIRFWKRLFFWRG